MIALEQLVQATGVPRLRAATYLPYLHAAMKKYNITEPLRQAAFLSQVLHESNNLAAVEENLNYSAEALMRVWPSRFKTLDIANQYARKPEKIANKVYANRMGNGDEASGDGWRYKGAGLIQLTGKDNQFACGLALEVDLLKINGYLRSPEGACMSAGWYWDVTGLNKHADNDDLDAISDLINIGRQTAKEGDAIGYAHRASLYKALKQVLGV